MIPDRNDAYAATAATARISHGPGHAAQYARHDGNEFWSPDASWTDAHAGCQTLLFSKTLRFNYLVLASIM